MAFDIYEQVRERERQRLLKVREGDRVWLDSSAGKYPRGGGIGTVRKVTATQIVVTSATGYEQRFRRVDGYKVGGVMNSDRLGHVATPKQVQAWEEEQQAQARKAQAMQDARDERLRKEEELQALFAAGYKPRAVVQKDGSVQLSLDISEEQVRRIAAVLKAHDAQ